MCFIKKPSFFFFARPLHLYLSLSFSLSLLDRIKFFFFGSLLFVVRPNAHKIDAQHLVIWPSQSRLVSKTISPLLQFPSNLCLVRVLCSCVRAHTTFFVFQFSITTQRSWTERQRTIFKINWWWSRTSDRSGSERLAHSRVIGQPKKNLVVFHLFYLFITLQQGEKKKEMLTCSWCFGVGSVLPYFP